LPKLYFIQKKWLFMLFFKRFLSKNTYSETFKRKMFFSFSLIQTHTYAYGNIIWNKTRFMSMQTLQKPSYAIYLPENLKKSSKKSCCFLHFLQHSKVTWACRGFVRLVRFWGGRLAQSRIGTLLLWHWENRLQVSR